MSLFARAARARVVLRRRIARAPCSRTSHARLSFLARLNARALALRTPRLVRHHKWTHMFWIKPVYIYIYTQYFLCIYIYISIYAANRGSLEFDSRVLGDWVLPLIVWYMFSIIYFFIYLIYQGRWPGYILMKMIPKERSSWVSVPWMFQYIVNSYPPIGNHSKMGIDNLCLHPFTLLFVEVPVRTNDHHSIVVQISFFRVWYFDKI